MKEKYIQKAITTTIKANSKCTVKLKDNFYSIEFSEERIVPELEGVDLEKERLLLWDDVNAVVDEQINDILKTFK